MELETWLHQKENDLDARGQKILRLAGEVLLGNILTAPEGKTLPWGDLRAACPSTAVYRGVWNWDSCFHAFGMAHWDTKLAREQLEYFFRSQREDGCFIDCCEETGQSTDFLSKPPVIFPTYAYLDYLDPDDAELARVYPKLCRCEEFWRTKRSEDGLFFYASDDTTDQRPIAAKWESGWDNSPRYDGDITEQIYAIDLNCYMVLVYRSLVTLAGRLGREADAERYHAAELALTEKIETTLWSDTLGAYSDTFRPGIPGRSGATGVLTPASFMPLFVKIASADHAEKMMEIAKDTEKFYPQMPAVSYDSPAYTPDKYWRGPTWINIAYMAIKGLKNYGYTALAEEYREQMLKLFASEDGGMWEYYDSKAGKGLGAPRYGWTAAFAIAFLLDF